MKLLRFPRLFGFSRPRHNFSDSNILLSEKFTGLLDDNHHTSTCESSTVGLVSVYALDLLRMRSPDITNQLQPLFGHWKQSPVSFNHCWLTTVVEAIKNKWPQQFQQHFNPQVLSHRTGCTGPTQLVVSSNSSKTKPAERKKICSVGVPSPHRRWEGCEGKADLQIKLILIREICGKQLRN